MKKRRKEKERMKKVDSACGDKNVQKRCARVYVCDGSVIERSSEKSRKRLKACGWVGSARFSGDKFGRETVRLRLPAKICLEIAEENV